ncbi:maleylpyruvate isomerase N-terminal domain-containing protein [Dactylosporangium sp. AC04546]|uniref:maleylpyruvate isomerase N-terminal domain-containing protein n=1 Tax=Dactylosporangium sp. AC04546 TaxID=2862460 RepID=UPI0027E08A89|nr:maleylpyruvate isomerase N-terminal domain-containing protein [Dactylosporangium sp. AC04546]WVK85003.1 maleylpyruvate isomerase N-terminal domain-containing protein [Dactylosporangium sp. AC04546]
MERTLKFPDPRLAASRTAVSPAPSLDAQVPTCPEWTLFDLVQHLGQGHRSRAAAARPTPARSAPEGEVLPAWSATARPHLLAALREAGPDRGYRTGWRGVTAGRGGIRRRRRAPVRLLRRDVSLAVRVRCRRVPRR